MNKPGSSSDFMRTLLLGAIMIFAFQYFFNRPNTNKTPPRTAPALVQAFAGIDPATVPGVPALDAKTGNAEIVKLQANIKANESDALAQWSRLRIGLIQQYILNTLQSSTRKSGIAGFGSDITYYPVYDDIIRANVGDVVEAQALYQEGDLLWRQSLQKKELQNSAVTALESLVHKGRSNAAYRDYQIYVPAVQDPAKVSLEGVPQGGFKPVKIGDLRGNLQARNPQGILDRVDEFYASTPLYKIFDGVVRALGANPSYSYGLAVLLFAVFTRTALQPIYKKQYESMKGMAAIAPEMKKIQEKYKGRTEQNVQMLQMKEIQDLQRRHGVNPMLGCGLAFLQMPIFFFIVYPMIQHYEPKMELALASFLWIPALARPDIILLVLYGASMFFSFRLSATPPADDMQRQQQMLMSFAFPFIFPIFIATYPAAFTMYWMTYNAIGTFYQWRLMKSADPSKNFWLTLKGDGLIPRNPTADAVPPRPTDSNGSTNGNGNGNGSSGKGKSVKIHTKTPSLNGTIDGKNGSLGGTNGTHKSAPEGTVLEPSADEVERRKKKKK